MRVDGFSLPQQHSLKHYHHHIENFGVPNNLCSSITESKHITAVKKPWCQSSRYEALKQMLTINTQNNKLATAWADFSSCGMLQGTCLGEALKLSSHNPNNHINKFGSPNGNGESGTDLAIDNNNNNNKDDGSPGPVDGPSILSKAVLTQKKGLLFSKDYWHSEPQLILLLSSKVPMCLIPSAWGTCWSSKPWWSHLTLPLLPVAPDIHRNPSPLPLPHHRKRWEYLHFPLSHCCLLCTK